MQAHVNGRSRVVCGPLIAIAWQEETEMGNGRNSKFVVGSDDKVKGGNMDSP